jgi:hypothetical protein
VAAAVIRFWAPDIVNMTSDAQTTLTILYRSNFPSDGSSA